MSVRTCTSVGIAPPSPLPNHRMYPDPRAVVGSDHRLPALRNFDGGVGDGDGGDDDDDDDDDVIDDSSDKRKKPDINIEGVSVTTVAKSTARALSFCSGLTLHSQLAPPPQHILRSLLLCALRSFSLPVLY